MERTWQSYLSETEVHLTTPEFPSGKRLNWYFLRTDFQSDSYAKIEQIRMGFRFVALIIQCIFTFRLNWFDVASANNPFANRRNCSLLPIIFYFFNNISLYITINLPYRFIKIPRYCAIISLLDRELSIYYVVNHLVRGKSSLYGEVCYVNICLRKHVSYNIESSRHRGHTISRVDCTVMCALCAVFNALDFLI